MTATLGCLKAGDIKFDPELPKWKSEAIATLGFGNLNKVQNCPSTSLLELALSHCQLPWAVPASCLALDIALGTLNACCNARVLNV